VSAASGCCFWPLDRFSLLGCQPSAVVGGGRPSLRNILLSLYPLSFCGSAAAIFFFVF
jgi:hypothetical protein